MRLCGVDVALLTVLFFLVQIDAFVNATASAAALGTFSFSRNRPGPLVSEPPYTNDEERVNALKSIGHGHKAAKFMTKSKHALRNKLRQLWMKLQVLWWWVTNANPHVVYVKLQLDHVNKDILSNAKFHLWVKYVYDYNLEHPIKKVSILAKLRKQYGDRKVAMMLEKAKRGADSKTRALGRTLQMEQMLRWSDDRLSADRLYTLLQVDEHKPSLLTGRALTVWNIYVNNFNPGKPTTLFTHLYHTIDDASLSLLLIAAKRAPKTATLATTLQVQLRNVWLKNRVAPKRVFMYLGLDKHHDQLLDQPEMIVWMRYAKLYWGKTRTDVTLNEMLENFYNANEVKIIIGSATTAYGKYLAKKLANTLA